MGQAPPTLLCPYLVHASHTGRAPALIMRELCLYLINGGPITKRNLKKLRTHKIVDLQTCQILMKLQNRGPFKIEVPKQNPKKPPKKGSDLCEWMKKAFKDLLELVFFIYKLNNFEQNLKKRSLLLCYLFCISSAILLQFSSTLEKKLDRRKPHHW